jgi:hypothetical protein
MMATQQSPQRTRPAVKPDKKTRVALEKAMAEVEAALARAKEEARARLKAEAALAEAQQALAAFQAEVEQERQAGLKAEQARTEAERALAEAKQATGIEAETIALPPPAPEEGGAEQRVTFIIRLTVDERGQPRRTEVEHAQSGKKETFPGLNVQRLVAFMKVCLSSQSFQN